MPGLIRQSASDLPNGSRKDLTVVKADSQLARRIKQKPVILIPRSLLQFNPNPRHKLLGSEQLKTGPIKRLKKQSEESTTPTTDHSSRLGGTRVNRNLLLDRPPNTAKRQMTHHHVYRDPDLR